MVGRKSNSQNVDHESDVLTTTSPSHLTSCILCFDVVGWATGRASGP